MTTNPKPFDKPEAAPSNLFQLNLVFATFATGIASRITAGLKFLQILK